MKKFIKIISLTLALVCICGVFAACGNISQSYADKVNKAAEKDEHITYTEVLEDLGEDAIDITLLKSGVIIAVKGCSTVDDIKAKLDDGKTVKGIVVTVVGGKAISAEYREITNKDV